MPLISRIGSAASRGFGLFGAVAKVLDPYFKYVTLLLHGDGTNGAQNNTFLDSSTNNLTITRNGNTTQGTFSPYGANWSNYIAATSSLQAPSGSSISGTGNFTLEVWINPTTFASGYQVIFANDTSYGFSFSINSTGTLGYGRSLISNDGTTTGTVTFNQWNHIAFVRSGTGTSQFICYINGVSAGSFTNSTSYAAGIVRIGTDGGGSSLPYTGYISNLRSNTTAVYTSAFTPPTAPLSAISGTTLLTCQSNRFIDNSTNAFAITVNGSISIQRFSPFSPPTAYSTSVIGGSGYFDGNVDYLSAPSNANLALGSGDFTVEFWIYPLDNGGSGRSIIDQNTNGSLFYYLQSGTFSFRIYATSTPLQASLPYTNGWVHVAVSRQSNTLRAFINGALTGSTTDTNNYTQSGTYIGTYAGGASQFNYGYLADLRLVKGTAVYTSAFTPPTTPLTAITNTQFLLNYTNAGIYDNAEINDLQTVGNAQVSTSVKKFGTGSMSFDGTGDYIIGSQFSSPIHAIGSGDFTIEAWLYTNANKLQIILDTGTTSGSTTGIQCNLNSSGYPYIVLNNTVVLTSSIVVSLSTWTYVAWVRSSGTITIYVNGVSGGTASNSTNASDTGLTIGTPNDYRDSSSTYHFNGYIDDLRITKGYARTITTPTAAFPNN